MRVYFEQAATTLAGRTHQHPYLDECSDQRRPAQARICCLTWRRWRSRRHEFLDMISPQYVSSWSAGRHRRAHHREQVHANWSQTFVPGGLQEWDLGQCADRSRPSCPRPVDNFLGHTNTPDASSSQGNRLSHHPARRPADVNSMQPPFRRPVSRWKAAFARSDDHCSHATATRPYPQFGGVPRRCDRLRGDQRIIVMLETTLSPEAEAASSKDLVYGRASPRLIGCDNQRAAHACCRGEVAVCHGIARHA